MAQIATHEPYDGPAPARVPDAGPPSTAATIEGGARGCGRRGFLGLLLAAPAAARLRGEVKTMVAFSNRAHLALLPHAKEPLTRCLTTVFGCPEPLGLPAPGLSEPILAFRFPSGGSMSVEFRPDALAEPDVMRGAWLEVKTDDPAGLQKAVTDAGLRRVRHPATDTFYCVLPGGQVLGIVAAS
jgi:hypothetical protein